MKKIVIIPARFASSRFPGKSLVNIDGKTMIQRVVEQVKKAKSIDEIYVATDDVRILTHIQSLGYQALMTKKTHQSGTDRCAEVAATLSLPNDAIIVNVQGDEPFIRPKQIDDLVAFMEKNQYFSIVTLAKKINEIDLLENPNVVKVIFNKVKKAIYFSRHPIPYVRGKAKETWLESSNFYKHIGMYAFRNEILQKIATFEPSSLEIAESLEQLRWLENGISIGIELTSEESIGIDTPEDLEKITKQVSNYLVSKQL